MSPPDLIICEIGIALAWSGAAIVQFCAWRSLRNIPFLMQLPWILIAYIGGSIVLMPEAIGLYALDANRLWLQISILMVFNIIFGLVYMLVWFRPPRLQVLPSAMALAEAAANRPTYKFSNIVMTVYIVGLMLLAGGFGAAGFVPAFSADPYSAKYLAGIYGEMARPYLQFIRLGLDIFEALTPLAIFCMLDAKLARRIFFGAIVMLYLLAITLSLRRALVVTAILPCFLAFFMAWRGGRGFGAAVALYLAIFILGSSISPIVLYLMSGGHTDLDLTAPIRGATDLSDMSWFWDQWHIRHWPFSLGRTVVGGAIPYHFEWNISVLTKLVVGADPETAATGGFRLPWGIQGYISFGWIGVALFAVYTAIAQSVIVRSFKSAIDHGFSGTRHAILLVYILVILTNAALLPLNVTMDQLAELTIQIALLYILAKELGIHRHFPLRDMIPAKGD